MKTDFPIAERRVLRASRAAVREIYKRNIGIGPRVWKWILAVEALDALHCRRPIFSERRTPTGQAPGRGRP